MKANRLALLTVITFTVIIAAVYTSYYHSPETGKKKELLFPDLNKKINSVSKMTIHGNQSTITLRRDGNQWKIKEADDYPALFDKIKQTVIAVSELKILAYKTRNVALYPRLGVEDVNKKGAKSKLVTLEDNAGNQLASLIAGNKRHSKSAIGKAGLYVRLPGHDQALLVEGRLDVSANIIDWFQRNLFNIEPDRIREIKIEHKDSDTVMLNRRSSEDDFTLVNIPEGKQAKSIVVLNRMKTMLEDTLVDNVKSAGRTEFPDTQSVATVMTFDGLIATVTSTIIDDTRYARFAFSYVPPSPDTTGNSEKPKKKESGSAGKDVGKEVQRLTANTKDWVYEVPEFKFELFTKKMDDLVQDIPEEKKAVSGTSK
ncbi:MAG: DUF4340 domain-containing protein [Gammaproteobacteria bacterium]